MVNSALLPAAVLVPLAAAALYPGVTTDNHTCVLSTLPTPIMTLFKSMMADCLL